jgi:hypothetical protein
MRGNRIRLRKSFVGEKFNLRVDSIKESAASCVDGEGWVGVLSGFGV